MENKESQGLIYGDHVPEHTKEIPCKGCGNVASFAGRTLCEDERDERRKEDGRPLMAPFDLFICTNKHTTKVRRSTFD